MKNIYKSMVATGVLALASTSLYAGDRAGCHSNKACDAGRPVSTTVQMFQNGYLQTSKGVRLDTDRLASSDTCSSHRHMSITRNDPEWKHYNDQTREWKQNNNSKTMDMDHRPERNQS